MTEPEYQLEEENRRPLREAQKQVQPLASPQEAPVDGTIENPTPAPQDNIAQDNIPQDVSATPSQVLPTPNNPDTATETTPPSEGITNEEPEKVVPYVDLETSVGSCKSLLSPKTYTPTVGQKTIKITSSTKMLDTGGALLVEIVENNPQKGSVVLINFNCEFAANLKYELPTNIGTVFPVYFVDQNGDGPSEDDIRGIGPAIDTTDTDDRTFSINLAKESDISPLSLPFIPMNLLAADDQPDNITLPSPQKEEIDTLNP